MLEIGNQISKTFSATSLNLTSELHNSVTQILFEHLKPYSIENVEFLMLFKC